MSTFGDSALVAAASPLEPEYAPAVKGITSRWLERSSGQPVGMGPRAPVQPNAVGVASPALVDRILEARGLQVGESASRFLDPRLTHLHDPRLLSGVDRAAERMLSALDRGEKIAIYGDYDVDGVTATSILFHTLRELATTPRLATGSESSQSGDVITYIPHRMDEGYGLNTQAIEHLASLGVGVIVTVDCGINAFAPAVRAKELGVDLIITDHHNPPASVDELPVSFATVHPRYPGGGYPFGDLCGAGVAYKLAWRLCTLRHGESKLPSHLRSLLVELLAFAALGVIADVVPLVDENRVIARFGLERIKGSSFIGLRALVEASDLGTDKVKASDVGFRLAPRLNAAGRMGHAKDALELFTTADPSRAATIAAFLSKQNDLRREVERRIADQAAEMAHSQGMTGDDCRAIVLAHKDWHAGVVGIACSRLVERFNRPTILMQIENGECHGSGRSIDGFNLHAGLDTCRAYLDKFGGHDMAAGLHLSESKLPDFVRHFTQFANAGIDQGMLSPAITVDADAELAELTLSEVHRLESLAPFGRGNPEPRIRLRNVRLAESPRPMGQNGRHVSLLLQDVRQHGTPLVGVVAWDWARILAAAGDPLRRGTPLELIVKPSISTWTGKAAVEAQLCDLAVMRSEG